MPITGYDRTIRERYAKDTIERLRMEHPDWNIVNPFTVAERVESAFSALGVEPQHQDYMDECFKEIRECDMVIFAPGWNLSKGCTMEMNLSRELDLEYMFLGY